MDQHERTRPETTPSLPAPAPDGAPGANLTAIRQAGAAMLNAADDAISRVLSGDSPAFNAAVRQEGGE